jgi:5-methylcytosine-specific restriction endonuclease McrA
MRNVYVGKLCDKHPEAGGQRNVSNNRCFMCADESSKKWRVDHAEEVTARRKRLHVEYKTNSPEAIKASRKKDYLNNYDRFAENVLKRKRLMQGQCPKWADKEAIRSIYRKARDLGLTVDHVVPLRGKTVSGLHVEANLQLLSHVENSKKLNRFDGGTIAGLLGETGNRV